MLAGAGFALVAGLYAALLLLGFELPMPRPGLTDVHGPLMVFGFVGTLIALERAVALGARWAVLAPACSAGGGLALITFGTALPGKVLLAAAAVALLGVYRALWRRQQTPALLAQAAGAFAWYAAIVLWLAGLPVAETAPWMAVFVVATIAGERLELAHVAITGPQPQRWFLAVLIALTCGAAAATIWPDIGTRLFGAGLLAVVAWLTVFDVARRTIRSRGLPRYVAAGLLAGYGWLGLAALLWTGAGQATAGPRYDAVLHAVFLGFTLSMIFAHAPVILPAVLRRPLPYGPVLYAPLALLHVSLLVRVVAGDGLGLEPAWRWAGAGNVAAVLTFAGFAAALTLRARRQPPATGRLPRPEPASPGRPADPLGSSPSSATPGGPSSLASLVTRALPPAQAQP